MNIFPQNESVSTKHLLACLGLAIDETKLVRSLIQSKHTARKLKKENPLSKSLAHLNREIDYLEAKLIEVRSRANRC